MHIALLRVALSLAEINQLIHEFPQFLFLSYPEKEMKELSQEHWAKIEILFGSQLKAEELRLAHSLKWIHTPTNQFHRLCLAEIEAQNNILLTCTSEEHSFQIAEFVLSATLAYAKNLFNFKAINHYPSLLWDAKWRQSMWSLSGRTLVQIGMDKTGVEIAKRGFQSGMRVISIDKDRSFHPYCKKNLSIQDLPTLLPEADVVSVNLPRSREYRRWFGIPELKLLKKDAILIILGATELFDKEEELHPALFEKLRGCLIDAPYEIPLPSQSKLWSLPNLLITPDVSARPKSKVKEAFRLFRTNLRHYIHGNFRDMRHLISTSVELATEEAQ